MKSRWTNSISYAAATTATLVLVTAILFACSSNDSSGATSPDGGQDGLYVIDPSHNDAADNPCSPAPLSAPLQWHPPKPFNPSACTPSQIDGFVQSCVVSTASALCDAFRQQNPGCAACAYSSVDDAIWGPVVEFHDRERNMVNRGGCVAASTGELDEKGCGGAIDFYDRCVDDSCRGCFPTRGDSNKLLDCETDLQTKTICAAPIAQGYARCPEDAGPSTAKCFDTDPSFVNSARTYATFWCSAPAGADAGDAATD